MEDIQIQQNKLIIRGKRISVILTIIVVLYIILLSGRYIQGAPGLYLGLALGLLMPTSIIMQVILSIYSIYLGVRLRIVNKKTSKKLFFSSILLLIFISAIYFLF